MEEPKEKQEERKDWEKHHYGTAARWVKEVALVMFVSLVVQRFLAHGTIDDPVLMLGIGTTAILYAAAINLLLKS
jgi:hypothetical protein